MKYHTKNFSKPRDVLSLLLIWTLRPSICFILALLLHIYIHIHIHVHTYAYVHAHTHTHTHAYTYLLYGRDRYPVCAQNDAR